MKTVFALRQLAFVAAVGLLPVLVHAQAAKPVIPAVTIPTLPATSDAGGNFTPTGWQATVFTEGDLTGHGSLDQVFVLQDNDPANILAGHNTNPRILVVALQTRDRNGKTTGYKLAMQDATVIPRYTDFSKYDVLDGKSGSPGCTTNLSVANGTVSLMLVDPATGGTTGTTSTFKLKGSQVVLVETHAVSACMPDPSDPAIPDVKFPTLAKTGANADAFTPAGWILRQQATGDLNSDGKPDLVLLFWDRDPKNILWFPSAAKELDTNPHIIAIAFANADGSGYTLAAQSSTTIPRWVDPGFGEDVIGDPTCDGCGGNLKIARGAFNITFDNMDGRPNSSNFTFRFQNNQFELIGYESAGNLANVIDDVTVNFSTGVRQETKDPMEGGKKTTAITKIPKAPLMTLNNFDADKLTY